MVIGKIFKDREWRQIILPPEIKFENFNFGNMYWSWNEEKKILINQTFRVMIRIDKDSFFKMLSEPEFLQNYLNRIQKIVTNPLIIEDFDTWFNQEFYV